MNRPISTDNSDSTEDVFLVSSTDWNTFKKLYDRKIKKGYSTVSKIVGLINIHKNLCGWACTFSKK